MNSAESGGRIVVGVDGSASSKAALVWAARYAAVTDSELNIVAAFHYPETYGWSISEPEMNLSAATTSMLVAAVDEVLHSQSPITHNQVVTLGFAKTVLLEASKDAALLVVGCRGQAAAQGQVIGSVSAYLAAHARCPVVVVHGPTDEHL